jgi:hypothetical protein
LLAQPGIQNRKLPARSAANCLPSSPAGEGGGEGERPQKFRQTNWIPDQVRNDEVFGFSPGVDLPSPGKVRESWVSASLQSILRRYTCIRGVRGFGSFL